MTAHNPVEVTGNIIVHHVEHQHVFGRGANGVCRECGAESNAGRKRREARERKPAAVAKPFDLYAALKAKGDQ